ncbi:hypothetical protein HDV06_006674 [Boothiomyces sp. JEL0866]|nr:hypothetical protein HDV06_006674 [Boothiomyces sp. JEL0866]
MILLAFIQICATVWIIFRIAVRKTVRTFYHGFLSLMVGNLFLAALNFIYPVSLLVDTSISLVSFPLSNFLFTFIVLIIILLDLEFLGLFSILNNKISAFQLRVGVIFAVASYLGLAFVPLVVKGLLETDWAAHYYYYGCQIFAFVGILVDNSIAFYLPFLVYNYKQTKSKQISQSLLQKLKHLVLMNFTIMIIDWMAFALCFYANIILTTYDARDNYYVITAEILVGFHSIFQITLLNWLKKLSLTEMEDIPSVLPPPTIILPTKKP